MFNFTLRPRRNKSAETAKERLQILLAHERADGESPDYLPMLQKEILEVIQRHLAVNQDHVEIKIDRERDISALEINIEIPGPAAKA
ncbi:cell division topological specificity factor MinE [Mangrovicoccus algicola]|uniref:Cell division topological specificity factor n=1 Tax=Mangrovicoccus algicola TaxID=2771008 RepID=A0A8J6YSX5_9RHOB|nr:cell division topological specificity factor MinE [Mangrovicoccus algicola]MBE3636847.1 cell division topological specificity factor MinE [Mangrovicoccus algicola]